MASLGHKAPRVWSCQKAIGNQSQHWHTVAVYSKAMVSQEQGEVTPTQWSWLTWTLPSSPLLKQVQYVQECREKTFRRWWALSQASLPPTTLLSSPQVEKKIQAINQMKRIQCSTPAQLN